MFILVKILLLDFSTKKHTFLDLPVSVPGTTDFTRQVMRLSNNRVINFTLLVFLTHMRSSFPLQGN